MKFKTIITAAVVASLALAGCSKSEEIAGQDGDVTSIRLKINQGVVENRAEGSEITDGTAVQFTSGALYFTTTAGQITRVVDILTTGTADNKTSVMYADITGSGGEVVENIPQTSQKIYFFGNVPVSIPTGGNISAVIDQLATIQSQFHTSGGIQNATLFGQGTVDPVISQPYDAEAIFNVEPLIARIEITKLEADGVVTGFDVDGIFINQFYSQVKLDGTTAAANHIAYTSSDTWVPDDASVPMYASTYDGITYDYDAVSGIGALTGTDYEPLTGDVWTYNVFAATVPHIIVKLKNITTSDASVFSDPQYVTVVGFHDGTTSLTTFAKGKVYTIASIPVNEDNLSPLPEVENIDVNVEVTMMPWRVIPVTPEF